MSIKPSWKSPVKPPNPNAHAPLIDSKCRCSLFSDDPVENRTYEPLTGFELSSKYQFDFVSPSLGVNTNAFFEVRDLVKEIDQYLVLEKETESQRVKERIIGLLKGDHSHTEKMGELGLILFYLDHPDRFFPHEAPSLIAHRAQEIEKEVEALVEHHNQVCDDKRIPSGKTHYLLRAFAHMAMTSTQVYNKGGLYALISILESPKTTLSNHLQAEHHEHLVIVAKQILQNPAFAGLFQRTIEVHPTLQDAIRIDLKLNPGEHLSSCHVFWDCFMFVFSDIRQVNRPNCYAVAALIYAIENAPYKTIETMLAWLERGHYAFNDELSIPLLPLLEKRLVYAKDLQLKLETDKALTLTTFRHISSTLNASSEESSSSSEPEALQSTLNAILNASEQPDNLPYAEKLYHAYKYITLSHLALGVMELTFLNSASPPTPFSSNEKEVFLETLEKALSHPKMDRELKKRVSEKLGKALWLENCTETDAYQRNGYVCVGGREYRFYGNRKSLIGVLNESMRVFFLHNGEFQLIERLTDLQTVYCQLVDEARSELPNGRSIDISTEAVKQRIQGRRFALTLARYASSKMKQKGISGEKLREADLFVMEQQGGCPEDVLQDVLGLQVDIKRITGAVTPYEFLRKLVYTTASLDNELFRSTPRVLAFTPSHHIWTLSPDRLRLLFETQNFRSMMQEEVFNPANARMRSLIPNSIQKRVIEAYAKGDTKKIERMRGDFKKMLYLTYEEFKTQLLDNCHDYLLIKEIIDQEFGNICPQELKLFKVLSYLTLTAPDETLNRISDELKEAPERLHPYRAALLLRELLIKHDICVIDPYHLEIAICYAEKLPLPFDLGDLNWDEGEYREDPPHPHLVIRYNWADRRLSYYQRESHREWIKDNKEFERFEIQHPLVKPSKKPFW